MKDARRVWKRKEEIAIFLLIPLILLVFFTLPPDVKSALRANLREFDPLASYTAIFVHYDLSHLLPNLIGYLILTSLSYSLCRISGRTGWFTLSYAMFFLILPPVSYSLLTALNRLCFEEKLPPSSGFSGIVSAIMGLTPIALIAFLERSGSPRVDLMLVFLMFCSSMLVIRYVYENLAMLLLLLTVIVSLTVLKRKSIAAICRFAPNLVRGGSIRLVLPAATILFYFICLNSAFPENIIAGEVMIDVITHCVDWLAGFWISYALLRLTD